MQFKIKMTFFHDNTSKSNVRSQTQVEIDPPSKERHTRNPSKFNKSDLINLILADGIQYKSVRNLTNF